ncbi:MAG: hypothetical protein ABJN36_20500 [Cyclobacteriaceae bacterium]
MRVISLILILLVTAACGLLEDDKPIIYGTESIQKRYIQVLGIPDGLEPDYTYWDTAYNSFSSFIVHQRAFENWYDWELKVPSEDERALFTETLRDDHFNRGRIHTFGQAVFSEALESISVTTDGTYSSEKDLSEIIQVNYQYPGLYVKNDYSWEGVSPSPNTEVSGQISETLKSFNGWGSKLGVCTDFSVQLLEAPTKTDTFRFTFRYEFEGGKIIETTTPPAIIQGLED